MYAFAYDPARSLDNSFVLIGEYYKDERVGWKLRLLNGVNFADYGLRNKTPMRTPEQIEHLKKLILDYNGPFPDYDNIHAIFIDAGSGGAGVNIADFLMPDWYEKGKEGIAKFKHAGLIDKEYSAEHVRKFPEALNKIRLISPVKFKSEIYRAFMEMSSQDLIEFPAEYNNKGYLTIIEVDEKIMRKKEAEIRKRMEEEKIPADRFQELLEAGEASPSEDLVDITLTDEGPVYLPAKQLRPYYPNLLSIHSQWMMRRQEESEIQAADARRVSRTEVLSRFLQDVCDTEMTPEDEALFAETLRQLDLQEGAKQP